MHNNFDHLSEFHYERLSKVREAFPDHPHPLAELPEASHVLPMRQKAVGRLLQPFESLVAGTESGDEEDALPGDLLTAKRSLRRRGIRQRFSKRYTAVHHSGPRNREIISACVIHCTQAYPALGSAQWFANPNSAGSAQVVFDDYVGFRTLSNLLIPWAAPGMNVYGIHFEFAGFVQWNKKTWMRHEMELKRGAFKIAQHAKAFDIPLKWLSIEEMQNGKRHGVTDHYAVSKAFGLSSHTDPRPDFPTRYVMELARHYKSRL